MTGNYEEISRRAYEFWEQNGRPSGRDQEFWFRAEEAVRRKTTSDNGSLTSANLGRENSSETSSAKTRRASKTRA